MNIVFFIHPEFLASTSMPRYAMMLLEGMRKRGHSVEAWSPQPFFFDLPFPKRLKKWLGYIDQFIVFPVQVKCRLKKSAPNTLFVFTDHALGPWVPLIGKRPHSIHCHDFLAQQSAQGRYSENRVSWTGRCYQSFIRRGYRMGKNFISVSLHTQQELNTMLTSGAAISEVIYNGVEKMFTVCDLVVARSALEQKIGRSLQNGYILHVGGNQWYKNRAGAVRIYDAWRRAGGKPLPLLLVGEKPDARLDMLCQTSSYREDILTLSDLDDEGLRFAYAGAAILLFPSKAEGFGWPIAEAMASGCPVVTTNAAPMTEVGGNVAFYIEKSPTEEAALNQWAESAALVLNEVVSLSGSERQGVVAAGLKNAKRFDSDQALNQIESIYLKVLEEV